MAENLVRVPLPVELTLDCEFRLDNDVWSGFSRQLAVQVAAPEFEAAKRLMQERAKEKIEQLLFTITRSDRLTAA
ncbi:MAG TPA: hypothetical protein VE994_09510 [Terriglobales bacterium]|nr:hypothetical protein [Terriglobales bacterium]